MSNQLFLKIILFTKMFKVFYANYILDSISKAKISTDYKVSE